MRSADITQSEMFSYRTLEQRIPASHPLRIAVVPVVWTATGLE